MAVTHRRGPVLSRTPGGHGVAIAPATQSASNTGADGVTPAGQPLPLTMAGTALLGGRAPGTATLPVGPLAGPVPAFTTSGVRSLGRSANVAGSHHERAAGTGHRVTNTDARPAPPVVSRESNAGDPAAAKEPAGGDQADAGNESAPTVPASAAKATTTTKLLDDVDAFVELLEERIVAQLERRGLRFRDLF